MNRRNLIIYIAGKYRGDIDENIHKARETAIKLWEYGFTCFCPHLNTIHFEKDCLAKEEAYLEGDKEILKRCNAILMLDGWQESMGATDEHDLAHREGIPVLYSIVELIRWADEKEGRNG